MNVNHDIHTGLFFFQLITGLPFFIPLNTHAAVIAGIDIPDKVTVEGAHVLELNGAGIRRKLFYPIYVGALYLERPAKDLQTILHTAGAKRIALYFMYDEVSADKLIEGWNDGFMLNHTDQQLESLRERLDASLAWFQTVRAGDTIYLDCIPDQGTRLSVNGHIKGFIKGDDFYRAVLKIWLGRHPAQQELKKGMLGFQAPRPHH